jgi:Ca2+-transporting ATPase
LADALGVELACGLGTPVAQLRLRESGPNELPAERPRSLLRSVLTELRETMIVVLLVAAALTAVTGDLTDCAVILFVITVNTAVGVVQERRAVGAMVALRNLATPRSTVLRDGTQLRVDTRELVVGDVLRVTEGDVVGADARLVSAHELQVDEALLTGESLPVERDPDSPCPPVAPVADRVTMLHAGTLVVHGTASALVVATGPDTELGHIAGLLREHQAPPTPLQRRLRSLGRRLSLLAGAGCALVVVVGLLRGQPWQLMALTGISLAVAAIPESLPAVVALALAGGTRRMAALGAIVRSLPAVEALGSVTVLATDKTGTLTTGSTAVVALWTPGGGEVATGEVRLAPHGGNSVLDGSPGQGIRALLEAAVLCNNAEPGAGGTEGALVTAALAAGVDVAALRRAAPRTTEVPFDSVRRLMRTTHRAPCGELEVVKGAPEALMPAADRDDPATAVVARWTDRAHRVLAVAAGPPGTPELLGLLALADPVRPEARDAVLAARAAGIRPVMITGDHLGTAMAVARATGVLRDDEPPSEAAGALRTVYARTDPAGKLDIVAAWRDAGHVVAMTGDGVNDAPALRAADVGVAMGRRGTDVARQAADLVLTDDSLHSVVRAIAEGRRVFDNIRRFVRYGLAGGLAEVLVMLLGPFLGLPLPLLPAQILWVNLLTHGLPGVAMGSEQPEPDVLHRPPRPPGEGVLTRRQVVEVLVLGSAATVSCVGVGLWGAAQARPWQSLLFVTLVAAQLGIALGTRSGTIQVWRMSPRGNPFLYLAVAISAAAVLAALYLPVLRELLGTRPLTATELGLACVAGALPLAVIEVAKTVARGARRCEPKVD